MGNSTQTSAVRSAKIQQQFDGVLAQNIRRLMDIYPEASALPFDLATITSLVLLIEREAEMKPLDASSADRYKEETLLADLFDMGVDSSDESQTSVQNLAHYGFLNVGTDGDYTARESAFDIVEILDDMFPGMPGINLIAYITQTIDEVVSGRKTKEDAIHQFDQTLQAQGISLSEQRKTQARTAPQESPSKPEAEKESPKTSSEELRASNLKQLAKIRSRTGVESLDPAIITSTGYSAKSKIKELFTTPSSGSVDHLKQSDEGVSPDTETTEDTSSNIQDFEQLKKGKHDPESIVMEPEGPLSDMEAQENDVHQVETSDTDEDTDPKENEPNVGSSIVAVETDRDTIETFKPDATVETTPRLETETGILPEEKLTTPTGASIEEQIQAFQVDLAMVCPICNDGKIQSNHTEKGKEYYVCQNDACNFISWGKPYHFACPLCKNSFLIEFQKGDEIVGLKCPKTTCHYRQENVNSPNLQAGMESRDEDKETENPKKKRKVIRKRRVQRKR